MKKAILAFSVLILLALGHEAGAQPKYTPVPIPAGANAPLVVQAQAISRAWCKRIMLDEYNRTPGASRDVAKFIQDAIDDFHNLGPDEAQMKADANALLKRGVKDPVFLAFAADALADSQPGLDAQALAALEKSRYNKFIAYMTSLSINRKMAEKKAPKAEQDAQFQVTLGLLREALRTDAFRPDETVALLYRLDSHSGDFLFADHAAEVCEILKSSPKVPNYVVEYYEGKRHVNEAWKARGDGYAPEVTPEGWKGFAEHLAQARVHLVKSWNLQPAVPRAATLMIKVAMGEEEKIDSMRMWFDRNAAAQLDFVPAYANMRWGLRPRWRGSLEQMVSFGEECARTGRYDTPVPYEYVLVMKDVTTDLNDRGAVFAQPQVNEKLLTVLNAYIDKPGHFQLNTPYIHAMAAIVAYRGGKKAEAKQHMEAINWNVKSWSEEFNKYVDLQAMIADLRK